MSALDGLSIKGLLALMILEIASLTVLAASFSASLLSLKLMLSRVGLGVALVGASVGALVGGAPPFFSASAPLNAIIDLSSGCDDKYVTTFGISSTSMR